jgi:uncharacterized membrane protein YqjE
MSERHGLFHSLRHILGDLLEAIGTRVSLFANEAEEARLLFLATLVKALLAVFCLGMGLVLGVVFLFLLFWESRLVVAGLIALGFIAAALLFAQACRSGLRRGMLFTATLAELRQDIRHLRGGKETSPPPPPNERQAG